MTEILTKLMLKTPFPDTPDLWVDPIT
ncbi:hypothetical protein LCGC14_1179880, partial [marine sediment metagenome]